MTAAWPWLILVGLGMFHGVNPAMGWLFAVALGLHRKSRVVVLKALVPITVGHALAVAAVVFAVITLGMVVDVDTIRRVAGSLLVAWAIYHALFGARHRVRFGMQIRMFGLAIWSFLMATSHGAGIMLVPALIPLCLAASPAQELTASGSLPTALAAVAVHALAMLATTALVSVTVYELLGVGFLRRGWINLDLIWAIGLFVTGLILLAS
jgi:hypothetical protein